MTRQLSFQEADLSIVLPGTWVSVPLAGDEDARNRISAFVKKQVGMNDRLARVRRDAREQLIGMAAAAKEAGAFRVGLSLEILPGVPFPAAMIMDFSSWPPTAAADDGDLAAPVERLAHGGDERPAAQQAGEGVVGGLVLEAAGQHGAVGHRAGRHGQGRRLAVQARSGRVGRLGGDDEDHGLRRRRS